MTNAMEPPTAEEIEEQQNLPEKPYESPAGSRNLTPQPSAKSPTPSMRATARSTARTMKSTKGDQQQLLVFQLQSIVTHVMVLNGVLKQDWCHF